MGFFGKVRLFFGATFMFGVAPEYYGMWALWRGASVFFPNWVYQWGDDKLYHMYQSLIQFFFETCTQVEVIMYNGAEEILKKKEKVLYLANHQSTADWLVANMVAIRANSLGHLRYVMKDVLQFIPLYGHYFYSHGCIYVKRGQFAQEKMKNSLEYLKNDKIMSWLIIFPEGTRYYPTTSQTIERSEKYARDNNLQILKYHLSPKVRGTWLALQHLHDDFDAIYDVSVVYENTLNKDGVRGVAPQLAGFLAGECPRIHIHLERIPMHEVPSTEQDLKIWMHNMFIKKDKLIEPFFSNDPEVRKEAERKLGGYRSKLNLWTTFSSFLFFSAVSIPFAFTSIGQKLYISLLAYGSIFGYSYLAVKSVC